MNRFGILNDNIGEWELIDLNTGEILADGQTAIQNYLSGYENEFTLKLL